MSFARIAPVPAILILCVLGFAGQGARAVEESNVPQPCETAAAVLIDPVDSARAKAGDAFRFKTANEIPAAGSHAVIPAGTVGYGLVMGAHHAGRGGRPGHLIVDTRFLQLPDGTRVSATLLPRARYDAVVMDGSPANAPGYIGFIPFASVMTGAYNTLHYGKEIVFNTGQRFTVVVGDELALGKCRLTIDSRAPVDPAPSASPSAAAAGASASPAPPATMPPSPPVPSVSATPPPPKR